VSGGALVEVGLSDMGVLEAGGEVISTGNDMGQLVRAFTGLVPLPMPGAVAQAIAAAGPGAPGTQTGYGLDILALANGVVQYEKGGLVAGYTTFMAFRREPATGVVVLSNRGQHQAVVPLARQILALLAPPVVSIGMAAPDLAQISFTAAARLSYEVQTSSDLLDWATFTTLTNSADNPANLGATIPMSPPCGFVRLRY
jgi:CubicO group peptidase (beta-lactamase class C family)